MIIKDLVEIVHRILEIDNIDRWGEYVRLCFKYMFNNTEYKIYIYLHHIKDEDVIIIHNWSAVTQGGGFEWNKNTGEITLSHPAGNNNTFADFDHIKEVGIKKAKLYLKNKDNLLIEYYFNEVYINKKCIKYL